MKVFESPVALLAPASLVTSIYQTKEVQFGCTISDSEAKVEPIY